MFVDPSKMEGKEMVELVREKGCLWIRGRWKGSRWLS